MKVCTDSCLFGALIGLNGAQHILDIGTGTGLLALMAAQRSEAQIDGIELDPHSAEEARFNCSQSPWNKRLQIFTGRIQDFQPNHLYDVIISNPPFFKNSLRSENENRNRVMQQNSLSFQELVNDITRLLAPTGYCWILLPEREMNDFTTLAQQQNLFPTEHIFIRNRKEENIFRVIARFEKQETSIGNSEMIIYHQKEYTPEFIEVLKPYYLKL